MTKVGVQQKLVQTSSDYPKWLDGNTKALTMEFIMGALSFTRSNTSEVPIAIQHVNTFGTITKKQLQGLLAITKLLAQAKESVAITLMDPITVTQPNQNKFGFQGNQESQEAHASRNTPGSMTAKTGHMRITTAANSKGSGKRQTKLKHVLVLTI